MKIFSATLALLLVLGLFSSLTAQDKKLTTINLGYSAISGSFAPLWVGFDQGLFAKYGHRSQDGLHPGQPGDDVGVDRGRDSHSIKAAPKV